MAKLAPPLWLTQLFDNLGDVLAGGKVYTYAAGTTTPLATYTDAGGMSANTNPVVLDSAGRADIWLTEGVSYKFILTVAGGDPDSPLETADGIISGEVPDETADDYEVVLTYANTPTAQGWMGGIELKRAVTFPIDFEGSGGSCITNPDLDFEISVQLNGVEVGTATISNAGVFTFLTTGGTTVVCVDGDTIDFYGPDTVGTAANIKATFVGALA